MSKYCFSFQSIGKGSLWCIDPAYRPNLLQALRKTPYHPYHQLQMTSTAPQNYAHFQSLPAYGLVWCLVIDYLE